MRSFAKRLLRRWGMEIRRIDTPTRSFEIGVENLKRFITPTTVIDVGVATGTPELYRHFPSARYLLVEANPAFAEDLSRLAGRLDAVVENVFCGREQGSTELRVHSEPSKSSLYESARGLTVESVQSVPVERLDALVAKHRLEPPFLLKVDVEGAELGVIAGAEATLRSADAVIAETSIAPRFAGGTELAALVAAMDDNGFAVFDILSCFDYPSPGSLYQADLVFVRSDAAFRQVGR